MPTATGTEGNRCEPIVRGDLSLSWVARNAGLWIGFHRWVNLQARPHSMGIRVLVGASETGRNTCMIRNVVRPVLGSHRAPVWGPHETVSIEIDFHSKRVQEVFIQIELARPMAASSDSCSRRSVDFEQLSERPPRLFSEM